jgi:hypothetical protein
MTKGLLESGRSTKPTPTVLYEDKPKGEMTCLLKWEPGATLPMHRHPEIEGAVILAVYRKPNVSVSGLADRRAPNSWFDDRSARASRSPEMVGSIDAATPPLGVISHGESESLLSAQRSASDGLLYPGRSALN